jgi:hypothetical protein
MNALLSLLPVLLFTTSSAPPNNAPGSAEAAFEAATLRQILSAADCAGLRFYNALPSEGSGGTVLVVGILADGKELTNGIEKPYATNGGTTDNPAAAQACSRVASSGQTSFSASISAADALALLDLDRCAGIGVSVTESGFVLSAYSSEEGRMKKLGDGEGFMKNSGDPCPTICGSLTNYVNEALLNK